MAGDWIKFRTGLRRDHRVALIAHRTGETLETTMCRLYEVACYFREQGKYGQLRHPAHVIDMHLGVTGFADALASVGWLRNDNGALMLAEFCDVSAIRKSLGRRVRNEVLSSGKCAACGNASELVVDHVVPVCRGGSHELDNLQALCAPCNRAKGRKTMQEFKA